MMKYSRFLLILSLIGFIFSCEPQIDNPVGTGNLGDLVPVGEKIVYVAIGNSLTAGFQNGSLYASGQDFSFPKLLAHQLGVEEFIQPQIPETGIGDKMTFAGFNAMGRPIINRTGLTFSSVGNTDHPKPYHNLGVPGMVAYDLIDESDYLARSQQRSNPFYVSILRNQNLGSNMLKQAIALNPNLITLWAGNNDVLGYATSGGTISTTGMPNNPVPTPKEQMQQILGSALQLLTGSLPKAKIIMFTIPDVVGTPYFNVVPWNALVLTKQEDVDKLNLAYAALGFKFQLGQNGFVAQSPSSPGGLRQLTKEDKITLACPQDSLALGWGSSKPIPNQYVLDVNEIQITKNAIADYNQIIKSMESAFSGKVFVSDMNEFFAGIIAVGDKVPGSTTLTNSYISGEFFSLDGIHPSSRGYGSVTNEIIRFINNKFKADIPYVFVQNLPVTKVDK